MDDLTENYSSSAQIVYYDRDYAHMSDSEYFMGITDQRCLND